MDLTRLKASLHPDITATEIDARQMVNGMLYKYEGTIVGDFRIAGDKVALIAFDTKEPTLVEPGTKVKVTGVPAVTLTHAQAMQSHQELLLDFVVWAAWRAGVLDHKRVEPGDDVHNGYPIVMQGEQMVRAISGPPELVRIAYGDRSLTTPELEKALNSIRKW